MRRMAWKGQEVPKMGRLEVTPNSRVTRGVWVWVYNVFQAKLIGETMMKTFRMLVASLVLSVLFTSSVAASDVSISSVPGSLASWVVVGTTIYFCNAEEMPSDAVKGDITCAQAKKVTPKSE